MSRIGTALAAMAVAGLIGSVSACENSPPAAAGHASAKSAPVPSPESTVSAHQASGTGDCGSTGKSGGVLVHTYPITGRENPKDPLVQGGTAQLWRSAKCDTIWLRMEKAPAHTRRAMEGIVGVYYPNMDNAKIDKSYSGTTRRGMESPAMKLNGHTTFELMAGFVDDLQYDFAKKIRL